MPLTGLQLAWFKVFFNAMHAKDTCIFARKSLFGIVNEGDDWAVRYQVAERRAWRANSALTGTHYCDSVESFQITVRDDKLVAIDETSSVRAESWTKWWAEGRRIRVLRRALEAKERLERERREDLYES